MVNTELFFSEREIIAGIQTDFFFHVRNLNWYQLIIVNAASVILSVSYLYLSNLFTTGRMNPVVGA